MALSFRNSHHEDKEPKETMEESTDDAVRPIHGTMEKKKERKRKKGMYHCIIQETEGEKRDSWKEMDRMVLWMPNDGIGMDGMGWDGWISYPMWFLLQ